jgi:hypothetical protein
VADFTSTRHTFLEVQSMSEPRPKLIAYWYNGVEAHLERAVDEDGSICLPEVGSVIERRRTRWKIQRIEVAEGVHGSLPVYTLLLASLSRVATDL